MAYKEIIRLFDERKRKLGTLIEDSSLSLKENRIHQIKGAIDEIELFLLTLQQYQERKVQRNFSTSVAQLPDAKTGFFGKVGKVFKNNKSNSRNFSLSESYKGSV